MSNYLDNSSVIKLVSERYACKSFSDKKISDEDFSAILESARMSPSSLGTEPYQILVVQNPQLREKIKAVSPGGTLQIPECSHLVIFLAKDHTYTKYDSPKIKSHFESQNLPPEVLEHKVKMIEGFQKGLFCLHSEQDLLDWAHRQVYIALGNMMIMAKAMGIESCPMEGFFRKEIPKVLSEAGVDMTGFDVSVMVAFGYPSPKVVPFKKARRPIGEIVKYL